MDLNELQQIGEHNLLWPLELFLATVGKQEISLDRLISSHLNLKAAQENLEV